MSSLSKGQEQQKRLKQEYGWFYEALTQILAKDDPMGLVRSGAPVNEYDLEVNMILLRLHDAHSPEELGDIIYTVFVSAFGKSFASQGELSYQQYKPRFQALGETIWNEWMRWKGERKEDEPSKD